MGSECIGKLAYEPTAPAIAMGSMFVVWLIDFFGSRWVRLSNMSWNPIIDLQTAIKQKSFAVLACSSIV
ncbi:solute carrier family 39 (zinc transporter), member 1/2/3 [Cryptococcus neoformans]|nr:solute carrier family 39 (zinc transporter), member 1/2/3 [Cryptococcus neoformans var. grubii]OXC59966.1 solute carrier family 39 (zinc transporter), member 1/2/3 [Cryptococcus neoformans var. grubii MW-RSA852]